MGNKKCKKAFKSTFFNKKHIPLKALLILDIYRFIGSYFQLVEVPIWHLKLLGRHKVFAHGIYRAWCFNVVKCFKQQASHPGKHSDYAGIHTGQANAF